MRITAKIDYAVRGCVELAAAYDEGFVKADVVAEAAGVPQPFLLGILQQLRLSGLVMSRRGAEGGYRLAVDPAQIAIADVIRAVDGPLANIAGVQPERVEYSGNATSLRDAWIALRVAMRSVLENITLADLVEGRLPDGARELLADESAWATRPFGPQTLLRAAD